MTNTKTPKTTSPLSTAFLRVKKTQRAVDAAVKSLLAVPPGVATMILSDVCKDQAVLALLNARLAAAATVAVAPAPTV